MSVALFLARIESLGLRGAAKVTHAETLKLQELADLAKFTDLGKVAEEAKAAGKPETLPYRQVAHATKKILSEVSAEDRPAALRVIKEEMLKYGLFGEAQFARANQTTFNKALATMDSAAEIRVQRQAATAPAARAPQPAVIDTISATDKVAQVRIRGNAVDQIAHATTSGDPEKIEAAFRVLRTASVKDPGIIVETTRNGGKLTPTQIMDELQAGASVTRKELSELETHLTKAAVDATMKQHRLGALDKMALKPGTPLGMDTGKVFEGLRSILGKEGLLSDLHIERAETLSPKGIYDTLRSGSPVSRDELITLESFYKKNFDTQIRSAAQAPAANQQVGLPHAAGSTGKLVPFLNSAIQIGSSIINRAQNGEKLATVTRNLMQEWETGSAPGFFAHRLNNIAEGTPYARTTAAILLAGTALVGANRYVYYSPEGLDTGTLSGIFEAGYFTDTAFDKVPAEVINRQYDRLVKDSSSKERFIDYTSLITGVTLKAGEHNDLGKLLEIARVLASSPAGVSDPQRNPRAAEFKARGLTGNDVAAYTLALGFYAGQTDVEALLKGVDTKDENSAKGVAANILNFVRDTQAVNLANKYSNATAKEDIDARDKAFKEFLGVSVLPESKKEIRDALLNAYANRSSQAGNDLATQVIGEYLVVAKVLKPDQKNANAAQGVIAENIESEKKAREAEGQRTKATAESGRQDAANPISAQLTEAEMRNNGREITGGAQPAAPARSPATVKAMFNQLSTDADFPELQGKGSNLVNIYTQSKDANDFESQLKKQSPPIPPATVKMLREYAYDR